MHFCWLFLKGSKAFSVSLKLIFEQSLKKNFRKLVKSYHSISLLPIFAKIFERVVCNSFFNYFQHNKLFTPAQSGFLPQDSCTVQLLSIIHEIQSAFDNNPTADVRGIFSDISEAFDKVWHDCLFKLKTYGVEGDLLLLLKNYQQSSKERVVLNS